MTKQYTIGVDYGTESGRVLLVEVNTGKEISVDVTPYSNGVIDDRLPGTDLVLEKDFALQDPNDYLAVLYQSIPKVLEESGVSPEQVIGIGIDFTSCTLIPLDGNGDPLCLQDKWRNDPHSWPKLWKHHAAQAEADYLNKLTNEEEQTFISRYGGKISSEWTFPKILEIIHKSPDIFEETHVFLEAADWITYKLSGNLVRSNCTSGYKALWHKQDGYPDDAFLEKINPKLKGIDKTKLQGDILPLGQKAGSLTTEMAGKIGLLPGTAVAIGIIDAHASVPAVGASEGGQMVMVMGTSTCHMYLSSEEKMVEGIAGVVEDGMIPGLYGYEAGQAAVGDIFAWFVKQGVPGYVSEAASKEGMTIYEWLERNASSLKPGESGLLALDWWNGNRSVLVDADLSGLIVGYSLTTKPEEIYRALMEATAFGTRRIIEAFEEKELSVNEIIASGGLPHKNDLLMQIYADVTNREIKISDAVQGSALGAAMFGAVAAGKEKGGYDTIKEATSNMVKPPKRVYKPIEENVKIYDSLYREYLELHDYFGKGLTQVMKRLKQING